MYFFIFIFSSLYISLFFLSNRNCYNASYNKTAIVTLLGWPTLLTITPTPPPYHQPVPHPLPSAPTPPLTITPTPPLSRCNILTALRWLSMLMFLTTMIWYVVSLVWSHNADNILTLQTKMSIQSTYRISFYYTVVFITCGFIHSSANFIFWRIMDLAIFKRLYHTSSPYVYKIYDGYCMSHKLKPTEVLW